MLKDQSRIWDDGTGSRMELRLHQTTAATAEAGTTIGSTWGAVRSTTWAVDPSNRYLVGADPTPWSPGCRVGELRVALQGCPGGQRYFELRVKSQVDFPRFKGLVHLGSLGTSLGLLFSMTLPAACPSELGQACPACLGYQACTTWAVLQDKLDLALTKFYQVQHKLGS